MDDAVQSPNPNSQTASPADDLAQITKDPVPGLTEEINGFEAQHPGSVSKDDSDDYQVMYNQGGHFKEQLEAIAQKLGSLERSGPYESPAKQVEEVPTTPEIEKTSEIAGYMEVVEKEAELTTPIHDDYTNKVLLAPSVSQNPVINLPLTEDQINTGLHRKVWEAISWLAVWCLRQVKMYPGKVKYKS